MYDIFTILQHYALLVKETQQMKVGKAYLKLDYLKNSMGVATS